MRRLIGLALIVTVVVPATAPAASASTAEPALPEAAGAIVLAAEEAEQLGPDPQPRKGEENPARELAGYEDRETPFTWGAAWILTFAGLVGLLLLGGLYQLLVRRPARESAGQR